MRFVALILLAGAAPANAQLFWQSPDFRGPPLVPGDTDVGIVLPGATLAEERANWAWQLRAALNVAKLQCKFDPTLQASDMYDGVSINHLTEFNNAYQTLRRYFERVSKTPRAAQQALDQYGTKTYSGYSTVRSQLEFCQTATRVGKAANFAARGSFTLFAAERLREVRNALSPRGEQFFRPTRFAFTSTMPSFDRACWDRRNRYVARCGTITI
jgi:hypothetical protein